MAKEKAEQAEMEFPHRYSVKEMGTLIQEKTILLFGPFIGKELKGSLLDAEPILQKEGEVTKVRCPFCESGYLKLKEVKTEYGGGLERVPSVKYHVGNEYEYICSNSNCDGKFIGSCTWIHID